jgi:hypothetical protein
MFHKDSGIESLKIPQSGKTGRVRGDYFRLRETTATWQANVILAPWLELLPEFSKHRLPTKDVFEIVENL